MGEVDHPEPAVVLADGLFPTHSVPLSILTSAGTLICCDGATDKALAAGCTPTLVIGDLDSLQADRESLSGDVIWDNGQENTDLEKAIERCINNGISEDRKSTRLNSSHKPISYAVFCLKTKTKTKKNKNTI